MLSADNLCNQFELRPGTTKGWAWYGSKLFNTTMVFLKECFEKAKFEKKSAEDDINLNLPNDLMVQAKLNIIAIFIAILTSEPIPGPINHKKTHTHKSVSLSLCILVLIICCIYHSK